MARKKQPTDGLRLTGDIPTRTVSLNDMAGQHVTVDIPDGDDPDDEVTVSVDCSVFSISRHQWLALEAVLMPYEDEDEDEGSES